MKKIYLLAIDGRMYYLAGNILPTQYELIDQIVNKIDIDTVQNKYTAFLDSFFNEVKNTLGVNLSLLKVEYIFRKM